MDVRSASLRAEAEAMLSGRPNRKAPPPPAAGGKAGGKDGGDGGSSSWVYKYLLYEPLAVSVSASGVHSCTLAGTAAAEAHAEGALYAATFECVGSQATPRQKGSAPGSAGQDRPRPRQI